MSSQANPGAILTQNLAVDFDALVRTGKIALIASHYGCYCATAAKLLDHAYFAQIVAAVETLRTEHGITAGCALHRGWMVQAIR